MSDFIMNIWSSVPDAVAESSSAKFSPRLPPQSPTLQEAWSPYANSKDTFKNNTLAHARVLAIFRSGRFPNKIDSSRSPFEELEPDPPAGLLSPHSPEGISGYGDENLGIRPDFFDEESYTAEESLSSASSSSSRSSPVPDWAPNWHYYLRAVLSSRSKEECIDTCRSLVISNEWTYDELSELAYQLVSSVLTGVPPVAVTTCIGYIEHTFLDISSHEAASYFVSCVSESAFAAWHHYWNPATSFSIYPGRSIQVAQEHLDAAYNFCRLLGSLFKANLVSRVSVREVIDLTLQNAVLLEHIDAIGHLLSYATPDFWGDAPKGEKDQFLTSLHNVLGWLCQYHCLHPKLVEEYEERVEEIRSMAGRGPP